MTATIKAQMINKIRKTDWLDRISKNVSINKVSAVDEHIGSSDEAYGNDFDKVVDMDEVTIKITTTSVTMTIFLVRFVHWQHNGNGD